MEDNNERFKKAIAIKDKIRYLDWHLSLIDKNGWGREIHYDVWLKNKHNKNESFMYGKNNTTISREEHVKAMSCFINSIKNDLLDEFKKL